MSRSSERDAAWRDYAELLGRLNITGESLETAEIDFKAGFDAAARSQDSATAPGRSPRATQTKRPARRATASPKTERRR